MRKIVLSKRAASKLNGILFYLEKEWSAKVKNEFIDKFEHSINIIKEKPNIFPSSIKYPKIRRCVVTKQISVFYKFDNSKVYIITLFDNRQDPNKLRKELK